MLKTIERWAWYSTTCSMIAIWVAAIKPWQTGQPVIENKIAITPLSYEEFQDVKRIKVAASSDKRNTRICSFHLTQPSKIKANAPNSLRAQSSQWTTTTTPKASHKSLAMLTCLHWSSRGGNLITEWSYACQSTRDEKIAILDKRLSLTKQAKPSGKSNRINYQMPHFPNPRAKEGWNPKT